MPLSVVTTSRSVPPTALHFISHAFFIFGFVHRIILTQYFHSSPSCCWYQFSWLNSINPTYCSIRRSLYLRIVFAVRSPYATFCMCVYIYHSNETFLFARIKKKCWILFQLPTSTPYKRTLPRCATNCKQDNPVMWHIPILFHKILF